jgi:hypothetical protein
VSLKSAGPLLLGSLALAGAGLGVLMLRSANQAQAKAEAQTLAARLAQITTIPYRTRRWAQQIAQAAQESTIEELGPERTALALAWILDRESHGGDALRPPGPGGTGDFAPRAWGSMPMPPDGLGWGRGLMQIDYGAHAFARGNSWSDPNENVKYGAGVLLQSWKQVGTIGGLEKTLGVVKVPVKDAQGRVIDRRPLTPDEKALARQTWARFNGLQHALNAYNAGAGNVVLALARGQDPDEVSSDRYGGSVIAQLATTPSMPGGGSAVA